MEKQEHKNETVKDKTKVLIPNNTWQFSKRKDEKKNSAHNCANPQMSSCQTLFGETKSERDAGSMSSLEQNSRGVNVLSCFCFI